jgi:sec-independent protein translocase protein TatC
LRPTDPIDISSDSEDNLKSRRVLPVSEHLEALRILIIRCVGTLIVSCGLVACFFPYCARFMNWPLEWAARKQSIALQGLVTTSPMGIFSVLIQICILGGLALASPFILFFIGRFIAPALTFKEKRLLLPTCLTALVLFLIGALFSYFCVLPPSLLLSMQLNNYFHFQLIWSAPHYYGLVVWMTLGIGLCFEFPLILMISMWIGLISPQTLKKIRKHMIVAILIVGAAIIPGGDPISLLVLATPLYLAYELVIWWGAKKFPPACSD